KSQTSITRLYSVQLSHDGSRVAFTRDARQSSTGNVCSVWNVDSGKEIWQYEFTSSGNFVFSATGDQIVFTMNNSTIHLVDVGKDAKAIKIGGGLRWGPVFSQDGNRLAALRQGDNGQEIAVWDTKTLKEVSSFSFSDNWYPFNWLINPDGSQFV